MKSPLENPALFTLGPVPITGPVLTTWILMALIFLVSIALTRRLDVIPTRAQAALEVIFEAIVSQIRDTMRVDPAPYLPLIGTLFLFILTANWCGLVPGMDPPTASFETDAALGLIVFCAVIYYGIRARGPLGYLKSFAEPTFALAPLNIIESVVRTFSLMVRLFGNVMSGVFVIGIVLSLAGLFVPIPFMALELLIGAIQAYIFTVLAMVFIASGVSETTSRTKQERTD